MVYVAVSTKIRNIDQGVPNIKKVESKKPDLVELGLDFMPDLDELALDIILDSGSLDNKIIRIRHEDESGPDPEAGFKGSEEKRMAYFRQAIDRGVAYVDIELHKYNYIDKKNTKLILSHHDFEKTPKDLMQLYSIVKNNTNADIIKFEVKANSKEDYKRVVDLIEQANRDKMPIIGIARGEIGAKSRIHPGNYITYAYLEKGTASGQYTVEEIRELVGR
jgi:3-dehydroquinate dehydratase type I